MFEIPSDNLILICFQLELVDYWGYRIEEHSVLTSDGYILGIHRIPGNRKFLGYSFKQLVLFKILFGDPEPDPMKIF